MAPELLTRAAGWVLLLGVPLAYCWLVSYAPPRPAAPPRRLPEPLTAGEWLALPFAAAATLATLFWLAVAALLFLSPVLLLAWVVLR